MPQLVHALLAALRVFFRSRRDTAKGGAEAARKRIGRSDSAIRVAVAHFPEGFGFRLIPVVQRILEGQSVASPVYIEPALLTRANCRDYAKLAAAVSTFVCPKRQRAPSPSSSGSSERLLSGG